MEQKKLTQEQLDLVSELESLFVKCTAMDIGFIFDTSDWSLSAFNTKNIQIGYASPRHCNETDKELDWDYCTRINNVCIDCMDTNYDKYFIEFIN